jgi:FkbM family methyltransferase
MPNELIDAIDAKELAALKSRKIRIINLLERKKSYLLSKFNLKNLDFLINRKFYVEFPEEKISPLKLPYYTNMKRSVSLFDQRELLHRAIIASAMRNGIICTTKNIIDAGSANGDCALCWAKLITGKVYAIDPSSQNLEFIHDVAELNSIKNIETLNYAIGDSDGFLYPLYDIDHTPFSTTPVTPYSKKNKISAKTLDSLYAEGKLSQIGYIHLDVEGMELDAIRGAKRIIDECAPVVSFEAHITVDDIESIFNLFRSARYSVFMINEATTGGRPDCVNFIALPESTELNIHLQILNSVKPNQKFFKTTLGNNLVSIP